MEMNIQFNTALNDTNQFSPVPDELKKEAILYQQALKAAFIQLGLYVVPMRWQWLAPIHLVKRSRVNLIARYDNDTKQIVFIMTGLPRDWKTVEENENYLASVLQRFVTVDTARIYVSPYALDGTFLALK